MQLNFESLLSKLSENIKANQFFHPLQLKTEQENLLQEIDF